MNDTEDDIIYRLSLMTLASRGGVSLWHVSELRSLAETIAQHIAISDAISRRLSAAITIFAFESNVAPEADDEILLLWTDATDSFTEMLSGPGAFEVERPSPRAARARTQTEIVKFRSAVVRRYDALLAGLPQRTASLEEGLAIAKKFLEIVKQDYPLKEQVSQLKSEVDHSSQLPERSFITMNSILESLLDLPDP